jgi:hypothetical protein
MHRLYFQFFEVFSKFTLEKFGLRTKFYLASPSSPSLFSEKFEIEVFNDVIIGVEL